jgi:hypothetical protein
MFFIGIFTVHIYTVLVFIIGLLQTKEQGPLLHGSKLEEKKLENLSRGLYIGKYPPSRGEISVDVIWGKKYEKRGKM